jgi:MioC protein
LDAPVTLNKPITILVGSMSGTAELVADEVAGKIEDAGYETRIVRMEKFKTLDLSAGVYLICTSTYGTGEVPDNAKALYNALQSEKPTLAAVLYGVAGLGDSMYPNTFCFGGKRFDEVFAKLGATRVGSRLDHDIRSRVYPEDAACQWAEEWLHDLAQHFSQVS